MARGHGSCLSSAMVRVSQVPWFVSLKRLGSCLTNHSAVQDTVMQAAGVFFVLKMSIVQETSPASR